MAARWPAAVERWRPLAAREGGRAPVELLLAIINHESGGVAGLPSTGTTKKSYTDAERAACGLPAALRARSLGLMQVSPGLWRAFNATRPGEVSPCDLAASTDEGAAKQIRIGAWYAALCLDRSRDLVDASAWPGGLPSREHVEWAALCYAQGIDGVHNQVAAAGAAGFPRTVAGVEAFKPKWGAPETPFLFARSVGSGYAGAPMPARRSPSGPGTGTGLGLGHILAVVLLLWSWSKRARALTS